MFQSKWSLGCLVGVVLGTGASPGWAASFNDDFAAAGGVADQYEVFEFVTSEAVDAVDNFTFSSGASFALDVANAQVDLFLPGSTSFNEMNLGRTLDAANQYDLTQSTSLTINVSGLDNSFFSTIRNPLIFGFNDGTTNPGITVAIQAVNFSPTATVRVRNGGSDLPGGAAADYAISANAGAFTLSVDADSYSLTQGSTLLIADTLHGLTFDPTEGATPFFGAQKVFSSNNTDFSVDAFSGSGTTAVPEPTTLALLGLSGLLIARRRPAENSAS